jgi:hypothetical protein
VTPTAEARRELLLAVVAGAAAAGVVLWGAAGTWSTFVPAGDALGVVTARSSGRELYPAVAALGWAGLAGAAVLVALRGWARRLVGLVLLLCGAGVAVDAVRALVDPPLPLRPTGHLGPMVGTVGAGTGWVVTTLVGAVLLVLVGVFVVVRGGDWVGLGSSYDAPGAAPEPPVTDKGVWDALDRGDDPTA